MAGHWREIKPKKLKASHKPEEWVFASYLEFFIEGSNFKAFRADLFRDRERKVFGAAVYDDTRPNMDSRTWATKVILDKEFRDRFITTDEWFIGLWRHH